MSTRKTDDYKGLTANELTRFSRDSLFRKLNKYHSEAEERAQRRIKDEALGYSQIVKSFLDAEKRVEKLKDEPKRLADKKRTTLNSEYDAAVKRGLIKLHDGCKELWVSQKLVEWMNYDEEYLRVKEELSDAGSDYNRYLALKVKWETENEDIIKAERIRTKREELLQADPEALRALGITPDPTFEVTKVTPQSEEDEKGENIRAALKSIHPSATDAEIEGMLKSV